jgi:hypothetical protein
MNGETPFQGDGLLETFVAELTLAAYDVALRARTRGTWLDLELDLWRALADTVKTWEENGRGAENQP